MRVVTMLNEMATRILLKSAEWDMMIARLRRNSGNESTLRTAGAAVVRDEHEIWV